MILYKLQTKIMSNLARNHEKCALSTVMYYRLYLNYCGRFISIVSNQGGLLHLGRYCATANQGTSWKNRLSTEVFAIR